jgi:hypothetical protein
MLKGMANTPPDFIVIRVPAQVLPVDVYALALELVERVHVVLEHTTARFHLKDRLDKSVAAIALRLARAQIDIRPNRWRHARDVIELVTDAVTMLDILARQHATSKLVELDQARAFARSLLTALYPAAQLGPVS